MVKLSSGLLALTLGSVVALASANAADMYRPAAASMKDAPDFVPVSSWTGFYAGLNGGYGFSDGSHDGLEPSGGFGGGQIGYNKQGLFGNSNLVTGFVADLQGADVSDTNGGDKSDLKLFGTIRSRLGYSFGNTLIYATHGFAWGDINDKQAGYSKSWTSTGYVVGGGLEYKINPAWSVGAEYQFVNLNGNKDQGVDFNGMELNTVRATLNYHIGGAYDPLK